MVEKRLGPAWSKWNLLKELRKRGKDEIKGKVEEEGERERGVTEGSRTVYWPRSEWEDTLLREEALVFFSAKSRRMIAAD